MWETVLAVIGVISTVLTTCSSSESPEPTPSPSPSASPVPTPTPCPTPTPAPEPKPSVFQAPDFALVKTPFAVTLCEPFVFNVPLYVDSYKVGTFGHDRNSGCMLLVVPGLKTAGKRILRTGQHSRAIVIFEAQNVTGK